MIRKDRSMKWVPYTYKPKDIDFGAFCDKLVGFLEDLILEYRVSNSDSDINPKLTHTLIDRDKRAIVVTIEFLRDGEPK